MKRIREDSSNHPQKKSKLDEEVQAMNSATTSNPLHSIRSNPTPSIPTGNQPISNPLIDKNLQPGAKTEKMEKKDFGALKSRLQALKNLHSKQSTQSPVGSTSATINNVPHAVEKVSTKPSFSMEIDMDMDMDMDVGRSNKNANAPTFVNPLLERKTERKPFSFSINNNESDRESVPRTSNIFSSTPKIAPQREAVREVEDRIPTRKNLLESSANHREAASREDPLNAFLDSYLSEQSTDRDTIDDVITLDDLEKDTEGSAINSTAIDDQSFKDKLLTAFRNDKESSDDDEYFHDSIRIEKESNQDIILIGTRNVKKDLKPVDHKKIDYPPFRKNLFVVPPELSRLSQDEVQNLRKEIGRIIVKGKNCPPPILNFSECGLTDPVLEIIKKEGYEELFPIQAQAIPAIMSGRDTIGIARTGSGKTLAFTLPMLRHILDQPPLKANDGPVALVIAPTRELALQIEGEIIKFASALHLTTVCGVGGAPISEQIAALKRGAHIIVCTPGRMIELLCANRGRVTNLRRVTYICLDEADRMFDLGFGPQITRIIGNIRPDKQIVMFSATFPIPLEALARSSMSQPLEIMVGGRSIASKNVRQFVEIRKDKKEKFYRLLQILGEWQNVGRILIFVDRQSECGVLYKDLTNAGYDVLVQHGGMDQLDRQCTIETFKAEENSILIATSILSRGLDVKGLELVINYDCPNHYEDYVHRVGRTGRAGKKGTAFTFLTPEESGYAPNLVRALKLSENPVPPELQTLANEQIEKSGKKRNLAGYGGHGYKFDKSEVDQKKMEIQRQLVSLGVVEADMFETQKTESEVESTTATDANEEDVFAIVDPQEAVRKAREYAMQLALQQLQQKEKKIFTAEIDINDLPLKVRSDITSKEYTFQLNDRFGVTVSARGVFVPPGNPIPDGESKLHLLLEGHSHETVARAKAKIENAIRDHASGFANIPQKHTVGRYSVMT